jgi:hypothetical protein
MSKRNFCFETEGVLIRIVVEFNKAWCGSYYIRVKDELSYFQVAHCKIATELNQTMLDNACHNNDLCNA